MHRRPTNRAHAAGHEPRRAVRTGSGVAARRRVRLFALSAVSAPRVRPSPHERGVAARPRGSGAARRTGAGDPTVTGHVSGIDAHTAAALLGKALAATGAHHGAGTSRGLRGRLPCRGARAAGASARTVVDAGAPPRSRRCWTARAAPSLRGPALARSRARRHGRRAPAGVSRALRDTGGGLALRVLALDLPRTVLSRLILETDACARSRSGRRKWRRCSCGAMPRTSLSAATEKRRDGSRSAAARRRGAPAGVRDRSRARCRGDAAATLESILRTGTTGRGRGDRGRRLGTTGTRELLRTRFPGVRRIDNPGRTIPRGLNRALAAAHHAIVARCDGHATFLRAISSARWRRSRTGGGECRGRLHARGRHGSSAPSRSRRRRGSARRCTLPHWRRRGDGGHGVPGVFRRRRSRRRAAGTTLERNEDYELNWRLRERGGTVWFDPGSP